MIDHGCLSNNWNCLHVLGFGLGRCSRLGVPWLFYMTHEGYHDNNSTGIDTRSSLHAHCDDVVWLANRLSSDTGSVGIFKGYI